MDHRGRHERRRPRPTPSRQDPPTRRQTPPTDLSLNQAERRARALQRFRKLAWELDIEGIKRIEGPLKNPDTSPVIRVTIAPPPPPSRRSGAERRAPTGRDVVVVIEDDDDEEDEERGTGGAKSAIATTKRSRVPAGVVVIDSDDDDDDDDNVPEAGRNPTHLVNSPEAAPAPQTAPTDPPSFYLGGSVLTARSNRLLRYQQRSVSAGQYPSPQAGLRFDLAGLRRALGSGEGRGGRERRVSVPSLLLPTQESVSNEYDRQNFRDEVPLCFDKAITTHWLREPGTLYKGFPMVEKTVFFCADNFAGQQSNCFFKAVAYQVYGARTFDARVKAEHLQYFSDVLKWPAHPRHEMYTRLNEWFYESYVSHAHGQSRRGSIELAANFYQLLTIPNCYIPMDMFEVTADLYNLFVVIYTLNANNVVTEMTTKGSYNARHVFILYGGNHFQPMVPNDYYASEFQLPRVTHYSTLNYPLTRARDKDVHTLDHVYRKRCRVTVDRKPGPPPVDVVFYKKTIDAVVNGKQLL